MRTLKESELSPDDSAWLFHKMQDLGFHKAGGGWDKTVWMNEQNEIMLIVGPLNDARNKVFIEWINYCSQNMSNKFLPDISKPVKITNPGTGTSVLIAKAERLFEMDSISGHVGDALEFLAQEANIIKQRPAYTGAVAAYINDPAALEDTNKDLLDRKGRIFFTKYALRISSGLEYLILHLGTNKLLQLAATVFDVVEKGNKFGFVIDLHPGNFMIAHDGNIVINDPWVKYGSSEITSLFHYFSSQK